MRHIGGVLKRRVLKDSSLEGRGEGTRRRGGCGVEEKVGDTDRGKRKKVEVSELALKDRNRSDKKRGSEEEKVEESGAIV